jgi:hypothetical protein
VVVVVVVVVAATPNYLRQASHENLGKYIYLYLSPPINDRQEPLGRCFGAPARRVSPDHLIKEKKKRRRKKKEEREEKKRRRICSSVLDQRVYFLMFRFFLPLCAPRPSLGNPPVPPRANRDRDQNG